MSRLSLGIALLIPFVLHPAQLKPTKTLGVNTAPVTLEVYSDFQCPHCKLFHDTLLQSIIHDYVNTGKIYLIHHDFPLAQFKYSRQAAWYAIAAATLNKYEVVGDALFARQDYWGQNGKVDEVVAAVLTPDEIKKVRALVKDPQINQELEKDVALGVQVKVSQTPTVIFTHRFRVYPIPANVSYPVLRRFLDTELLAK